MIPEIAGVRTPGDAVQRHYNVLLLLHPCCLLFQLRWITSSAQHRQGISMAKHERCSKMMGEGCNVSQFQAGVPSDAAVTLHVTYKQPEVRLASFHALLSPSSLCPVCVHLKWRQCNYAKALKSRARVKGSALCICFVPCVAWWQQFVKHTGKVTSVTPACHLAEMTPPRCSHD